MSETITPGDTVAIGHNPVRGGIVVHTEHDRTLVLTPAHADVPTWYPVSDVRHATWGDQLAAHWNLIRRSIPRA